MCGERWQGWGGVKVRDAGGGGEGQFIGGSEVEPGWGEQPGCLWLAGLTMRAATVSGPGSSC